jgi:hypothetical protein
VNPNVKIGFILLAMDSFVRINSNKETQKINYLIVNKFGMKKLDMRRLQSTKITNPCNAGVCYFELSDYLLNIYLRVRFLLHYHRKMIDYFYVEIHSLDWQ